MPSKSSRVSTKKTTKSEYVRREPPSTLDLITSCRKSPCNSARPKDHTDHNKTSHQPIPWSYDQTAATHNSAHSQYQARSLSGLPSAKIWPDDSTVPSRSKLDYDLLGLNHDVWSLSNSASKSSLECPYHRTLDQGGLTEDCSGYGLAGLDRFLVEGRSAQGVVYFGGDILHRAVGTCCCVRGL